MGRGRGLDHEPRIDGFALSFPVREGKRQGAPWVFEQIEREKGCFTRMRDVAAVERELETVAQRRDVLACVATRVPFGEREPQQYGIGWGRGLEQRDGLAETPLAQQKIGVSRE